MRLTQESEYAVKIVLYLTRIDRDRSANAREISDSENISLKFALKILRKLCGGRIVESYRGIKGGYKLRRDPARISVKDVVETMQGELFLTPALKGIRKKSQIRGNSVNEFLFDIQDEIRRAFTTQTFSKLADN